LECAEPEEESGRHVEDQGYADLAAEDYQLNGTFQRRLEPVCDDFLRGERRSIGQCVSTSEPNLEVVANFTKVSRRYTVDWGVDQVFRAH
jgi:hypothetical protein